MDVDGEAFGRGQLAASALDHAFIDHGAARGVSERVGDAGAVLPERRIRERQLVVGGVRYESGHDDLHVHAAGPGRRPIEGGDVGRHVSGGGRTRRRHGGVDVRHDVAGHVVLDDGRREAGREAANRPVGFDLNVAEGVPCHESTVIGDDGVVVRLAVPNVAIDVRVLETAVRAEIEGDAVDRDGMRTSQAVDQVELSDRLLEDSVSEGVGDEQVFLEIGLGRSVDHIPFEIEFSKEGVKGPLRHVVPDERNHAVARNRPYRGLVRRPREAVVGVVDLLHRLLFSSEGGILYVARVVEVLVRKDERHREALGLAGLERERSGGEEHPQITPTREHDVVERRQRAREDAEILFFVDQLVAMDVEDGKARKSDLIRFVLVQCIEIGLTGRGPTVPFTAIAAGIVRTGGPEPVFTDVVVQELVCVPFSVAVVVAKSDPVHVLVAGPPASGDEGRPRFQAQIERLERREIVVGLDVLADGVLPFDELSRTAVAALVYDAVLVVVSTVGGDAR